MNSPSMKCDACVREYLRGESHCGRCGRTLAPEVMVATRGQRHGRADLKSFTPPDEFKFDEDEPIHQLLFNWKHPAVIHLVGALVFTLVVSTVLFGR